MRLDVTWPQETGRLLQDVRFGGVSIWNLGANLQPGDHQQQLGGQPTSRNINDRQRKSLLVTFNFLVTVSQEYTVQAYWDDTNGGQHVRLRPGDDYPHRRRHPVPTGGQQHAAGHHYAVDHANFTPVPPTPRPPIPDASATSTATTMRDQHADRDGYDRTPTPPTCRRAPPRRPRPAPPTCSSRNTSRGTAITGPLEIYNGTGAAIDLDAGNYTIEIYRRTTVTEPDHQPGRTCRRTMLCSCVVRGRCRSGPAGSGRPTDGGNWFTGDDTVFLMHDGALIDVIGQIGFDPG